MNSIQVIVDLKGFDLVEPKIQEALRKGLYKAGLSIERNAKILSPIRTGRLRASINTQMNELKVTVQDNVNYGIFQEFGTKFMSAHPFMNPALINNINNIKTFIEGEVQKVLK